MIDMKWVTRNSVTFDRSIFKAGRDSSAKVKGHLKRAVSQATGKPGLIIEADHTDSRRYAPAQVEKQIQIFLEIIKGKEQR